MGKEGRDVGNGIQGTGSRRKERKGVRRKKREKREEASSSVNKTENRSMNEPELLGEERERSQKWGV